jgi:hypothetical protein
MLALGLAGAAFAEAPHKITQSDKITESVTVQSVDAATRHIVIRRPSGETASIKVPDEVKNFDQIKPGDAITATYSREVEVKLLRGDAATPKNSAVLLTARAEPGSMPGAVAASRIVVTGAVLAIDKAKHRVKLVNPKGGEVHEVTVVNPQAIKLLDELKVGDKVTAEVNEALLLSVTRG